MATGTSVNIQVGANTAPFTTSVNRAFARVPSGINVPINLPLGKVSSDLKQFEKSLDAATARVISFTATTRILYSLGNAIKRLTSDSIKVEDSMAKISAILRTTSEETSKLKSSLFSLANSTSTAFYDVAEAAEEFSRQGLSVAKTLEATNAALLISKLSGSNLKTTIEGVTAVMTTFNNESLGFIDVANKLSALDARFATSSAGLIEGLKRVGGVAADAGLSFEQTASAITVLKQVTGRTEAVLGNALKSIFVSLQSEKVQKDLKQIGVEVTDASGEFRVLTDVISDLSKAFDSLTDSQKATITQRVAGKYQANAFSGLITAFKDKGDPNSSLFDRALSISKNSENEATDRLKILNKTTASELVRLTNTLTKFGAEIGDKVTKPIISNLANSFTFGLESMNDSVSQFSNGISALITGKIENKGTEVGDSIVAGIGNALSGPGLALLGYALFKFTTRILKESVGAVKSILNIKAAQDQVTLATEQTAAFSPKLAQADLIRIGRLTTIAAKEAEILSILNKQYGTYLLMQSGTRAASTLFTYPGVSVKGNKVVKGKASGYLPGEQEALIREKIDIRNNVGGARHSATPMIKTLNVGNGPERVVVNSDEKIVRNFANSGEDAVINRSMMGYARGRIPNFAIGKVYRGYGSGGTEGMLGGLKGEIPRDAYTGKLLESGKAFQNLVKSRNSEEFFFNGPIEAYHYANIVKSTISTSLSPAAALRFANTTYGGIAEAGVRISSVDAIRRLSDKYAKRNSKTPFGTYLYKLARKKPFGLEINDVERKRGSYNQYPIEREINVFDPSATVFSNRNKFGFRTSDASDNSNLDILKKRLYDNKYKNRVEKAGFGYSNKLPTQYDRYVSKIDELVKKRGFSYGGLRLPKETLQIARGHIPKKGVKNFARGRLVKNFAPGRYPIMPRTLPRRTRPVPATPTAVLYNSGTQIYPPPRPSRGQAINPQTQAMVNAMNAQAAASARGPSVFSRGREYIRGFNERGSNAAAKLGTLGFALPFLGGAVGERVGGSNGRLISSASQGLGTAALVASINPLAGAFVGVITSFTTLSEAGKEFSVDIDGLNNTLSKTSESVKNNQAAFGNYVTTFSSFKDAISSGNTKDIANLSKQLGVFLGDIKDPELRKKVRSTNDLAELQGIGLDQEVKDKAKVLNAEAAASIGKLAQDNLSYGDAISNFFTREKISLGRELLKTDATTAKSFADKTVKSIDISKLDETTKANILAGKRVTSSNLKNITQDDSLLAEALRQNGGETFDRSTFAGALSSVIKRELEGINIANEKTSTLTDIAPLKSFLASVSRDTQTVSISRQEKFASSLDILSNKVDLASNSFGEVTKATLDYNIKVADARNKFRSGREDLNLGLINAASKLATEQNLTPENTAKTRDAIDSFSKNGDFGKFISDLREIFGKGFTTELESIATESLLDRRKLAIQEYNTLKTFQVNFKNSIEKLRAQQGAKLYGGLEPEKFRETLDTYTSNIQTSLSQRAVNKNSRTVTRRVFGEEREFNDPNLQRLYERRNVQVLDENAARGQAIIDKVRSEETLGLRGIDLSPNADKRLVEAKQKEVEFARKQVREATKDKLLQFQARTVGEAAPQFFDSINSQYKKGAGSNVPLLSAGFQREFQGKVATSDFQGAYDSLQRQRLIAEANTPDGGPLGNIKGAEGIRNAFTELENLLKNSVENSKLNDLIANEVALTEVKDKSVPSAMLSELKSINKSVDSSKKTLDSINALLSQQGKPGEVQAIIGARSNALSKIDTIDKQIAKIKDDNKPFEVVNQERDAILSKSTELSKQLEISINKVNELRTAKDSIPRTTGFPFFRDNPDRNIFDTKINRESRVTDYISDQIDENNKKLSEFQKKDSERIRFRDAGNSKISQLSSERENAIQDANRRFGEDLNKTIAPLMEEFIPFLKSLEGIKSAFSGKRDELSAAFSVDVSVTGSEIVKSPEFTEKMKQLIASEVYGQLKNANGVPPKIIPNKTATV